MKFIFFFLFILGSTLSFADFDETPIKTRAAQLKESIQTKIIKDQDLAKRVKHIRSENMKVLKSGKGTVYDIPQSHFEAEERMDFRMANKETCIGEMPEEQIMNDLSACQPDRAYTSCKDALETAKKAELLASDKRMVIQANSDGAANAVTNAVKFWNSFVDEGNSVKKSIVACENALKETIYGEECMIAYDKFFENSELINFVRNTCHPDSIDNAIATIISYVTRADATGMSQATKATKAKEFYNQARIKGMKMGEALFNYHQWMIEQFPDKFGQATAKNE